MNIHKLKWAAIATVIWAFAPALMAQISIPSDGSDGALNVEDFTTNVVDLSQAVTGVWSNASPNPGSGIYDATQWAVVFKYTSVNIPAHSAVVFVNHPTHAPVVWLVQSNVDIEGTLSLDGQPGYDDPINLAEPGPGGFRGGAAPEPNLSYGGGFGQGGLWRADGKYNNYGNVQIVPLIGGSGGAGGDYDYNDRGTGAGGGGGGAILVAASGTISIDGSVHANGAYSYTSWDGSGGAIRLIADQVLGSGQISAISPDYPGRIRIEANVTSSNLLVNPPTVGVAPSPLIIWPPATAPTVTITSIASQTPPKDPKAIMSLSDAADDLMISTNGNIIVNVQTANFPTNGTVYVAFQPRNGQPSYSVASMVNGTPALATWRVNLAAPVGHFVVTAHAVSN